MTGGTVEFSAVDRVLVLAPHPDDETLATGGLLQRAAAAGARLRVVFVTDGENNPWPQRVVESRWRIEGEGRVRWAARRRREALGALAALGMQPHQAVFLALPDQGLTSLLVTDPARAVAFLRSEIADWRPSVIVLPSARDRHPDHSALAVLARIAWSPAYAGGATRSEESWGRGMRAVSYLVHSPKALLRADGDVPLSLRLTAEERTRKRSAIRCHESQLVFHRRSFARSAIHDERFAPITQPVARDLSHPVRFAAVRGDRLEVETAARAGLATLRRTVVAVLVWRASSGPVAIAGGDGRRGDARLLLGAPAPAVTSVRVPVVRRRGVALLPRRPGRDLHAVFVKLERRFGWFDDDGWREVSLGDPREHVTPSIRREQDVSPPPFVPVAGDDAARPIDSLAE